MGVSQFAVIWYNPNAASYEFVVGPEANQTFLGGQHEDAISLAAQSINQNGKFVAFPVAGAGKSYFTTLLAGINNDLFWEADTAGPAGNGIQFRYVVAGNNTALSVSVAVVDDITVNIATNSSGVPTSTANQVMAAVNAHVTAGPLVNVTLAPGDDGTGIVTALDWTQLGGGHTGGAVATLVALVEVAQQSITTF